MNNCIFNDLQQTPDGVWVSNGTNDNDTGIVSELFLKLKDDIDLSSSSAALKELAQDWQQELQLSPLRANLLRAFEFSKETNVLEINTLGGSLSRYLGEQGLRVDVVDANYESARIAALRSVEFDKVNIINQPLSAVDFSHSEYDLILLVGAMDSALEIMAQADLSYQQAVEELIEKCYQLLSEDGHLVIAADNRQGLKYLMGAVDERSKRAYYACYGYNQADRLQALNITQWHSLLNKSSFLSLEEYYPFPDFRFPRVLLNKSYVNKNAYACQHLEGLNSRDYFYPLEIGVQENVLYEAGVANQDLGKLANSFLFILSKSNKKPIPLLDFAHLPGFHRSGEYETIIKKMPDQNIVKRIPLLPQTDAVAAGSVRQNFSDETYIPGLQLSVVWQRSLFADNTGRYLSRLLQEYFEFLVQLESGAIEGFNVDALPINIIVDAQGEYHLFDMEWEIDDPIDSVFIFYRALVMFVFKSRHSLSLNVFTRQFEQLGDFFEYGLRCVGLDPNMEMLELLRLRDIKFQKQVSTGSTGYLLTDLLQQEVRQVETYANLLWRAKDDSYSAEKQLFCHLGTSDNFQDLCFELPALSQQINSFRFTPFDFSAKIDTGFFGLNSIVIKAINDDNTQHVIFSLENSDEVARQNVASGVYYAHAENRHVFMFTSKDNFLEFNLPDYTLDSAAKIQITISYRIARSQDYHLAQKQVFSCLREAQGQNAIKHSQYLQAVTERDLLQEELHDIKRSQAWRIIQAYRDTFRISGYPIKGLVANMGSFIKRFKSYK